MNYRSIFLADDWAHQRYFGWQVISDTRGLRILHKRRAVVDRYLVLLEAGGMENLELQVRRLTGSLGVSDIIIHDFDHVFSDAPVVHGRRFRLSEQSERLLNVATFAINLNRSDEDLMAQMNSDYRRKIWKAATKGVIVEAYSQPDEALQRQFVAAFRDFAKERNLNTIDAAVLAAMYREGHGFLFIARKQERISNFLHVYKAGDAASFMYGVNLSKENDGAGQFLHFQAMRQLRAAGVHWYDLGGVVLNDPSDGIFNFKQKFGGELVNLGCEWRYTGIVASAAVAVMRALRPMLFNTRP